DAPGHTAYVRDLVRRGFYDGTTFHRVIPHFVVQGGDPNSKNADRADDGEGEGDRRLKAEFSTTLHYRPGTVGMARDADPDSGSCQFFIALENIPRLDGRYTIFGEVIAGLIVSRRAGDASGEVLTGPGKPKPYDPGNVLWKAPAIEAAAGGGASGGAARLELAVAEDGAVLDVRFPAIATPGAARLRSTALGWRFRPASYDGKPRKVRFEIGGDGQGILPPTSPGF